MAISITRRLFLCGIGLLAGAGKVLGRPAVSLPTQLQ